MSFKLPKDFFLGAAMSGPQTEGAYKKDGKISNIWDLWSDQNITDFHNSVGSYVGNNFYEKYDEDFKLLKDLQLDSVRTSIQWSRLLDEDENINPQGVEFYNKVIESAEDNGIELFMNLYHFDIPEYLFAKGGWENRETVEAYANYARKAFETFGKKIKYWFTFNEPIVEPDQRYRHGVWYPCLKDAKRGMNVQYNISLAHCLGVAEFYKAKEKGLLHEDAKIGLINCFAPPYTKENPSEADLEAVRIEDGINNRWWLEIAANGRLPKDVFDKLEEVDMLPEMRPGDEEIIKLGKVDWLGFNYYHPSRLQAPKAQFDQNGHYKFSDPYVWKDAKMNVYRGWEIYPEGIYDFGMKMKEEYPELQFFISENGMGVEHESRFRNDEGQIQDDYRIEFVTEHLDWIAKSIEDGAKCKGYHYWGLIDNWSWANAYKNRYGFVEVELDNKYNRKLKKSAYWLKDMIKNGKTDIK